MLPRSKRLNKDLFLKVIKSGRMINTPLFSLYLSKTEKEKRFSVSVPKKVSKLAVDRNKIRRRVYSIIKKLEKEIITGVLGVIVVKNGTQKLSFIDLSIEISKVFVKSGILK